MPQPRKALVSVDTTPSYHVVSRCVRRTFLFGVVDNKDFSHRRDAIVRRLSELTQLFCIDISARQTEAPTPSDTPAIFARLNINTAAWLHNCEGLERTYYRVIGSAARLQEFCQKLKQQRVLGMALHNRHLAKSISLCPSYAKAVELCGLARFKFRRRS